MRLARLFRLTVYTGSTPTQRVNASKQYLSNQSANDQRDIGNNWELKREIQLS
ncbi:MAG: hypothetical protein AAGC47_08445 [Bacteroidota bacterium]